MQIVIILLLFIFSSCNIKEEVNTQERYTTENERCFDINGLVKEEVCMSHCKPNDEYYDNWEYVDMSGEYCEYFKFTNKDNYKYIKINNDLNNCNGNIIYQESGKYEFSENYDNLLLVSIENKVRNIPISQFWVSRLSFWNDKDFYKTEECLKLEE